MKEFVEKLIARLEERSAWHQKYGDTKGYTFAGYEGAISIVNQLAEESSAFRVPLERGGCCEWKLEENNGIAWHCADEKCSTYNIPYIKNLRIVLEDFECICPYCGKRIKVVEVEGE